MRRISKSEFWVMWWYPLLLWAVMVIGLLALWATGEFG